MLGGKEHTWPPKISFEIYVATTYSISYVYVYKFVMSR